MDAEFIKNKNSNLALKDFTEIIDKSPNFTFIRWLAERKLKEKFTRR